MDHLDRPQSAIFPQFQIPYVCLSPYDHESFLSFPASQGYDLEQVKIGNFTRSNTSQARFDDLPALQSFLQSWLFFGLLHEMHFMIGQELEINDYVSEETFLVKANGEKTGVMRRLNTSNLQVVIEQWYDLSQNLEFEDVEQQSRHLDHCLDVAYNVCYRLVKGVCQIDERLLLSFVSLGNTIENANLWVYNRSFYDGLPLSEDEKKSRLPHWIPGHRGWDAPKSLFDRLILNGWCPSEVGILQRDFETNEIIYASQMPRYGDRSRHRACDEHHCKAANIDTASYQTKHHDECQDPAACETVVVDNAAVCDILAAGLIPLVLTTELNNQRPEVKIVPHIIQEGGAVGNKLPYICISHVWAHGLGNVKQNALPACQIKRLHRHTYPIHHRGRSTGGPSVSLFWMDTLCVPVQPEHHHLRKKAISQMAEVYRGAMHVLVLDETLLQTSLKIRKSEVVQGHSLYSSQASNKIIHQKELSFSVMFSDWWRRLWTLQEGMLSTSLLICFKEGLMVQMQQMISQSSHDHVTNRADMSSETMKSLLHNLIDRAWEFNHISHRRKVITLLCNRSTSRPADEASCLATLMGVDVTKILDAPEEFRMQKFYISLDTVPAGLMFLPGPKLAIPGFRWAPRSLMGEGGPSMRYVYAIMAEGEDTEGRISDHGLMVSTGLSIVALQLGPQVC